MAVPVSSNKYMEKLEIREYKASIPLEARRQNCEQIMQSHPAHTPLIVLKSKGSKFRWQSQKFILPYDMPIGTVLYAIRKSLKLGKNQGLYLFLDEMLPHLDARVGDLHQRFKAEDGFLYLVAAHDADKGSGLNYDE